MRWRSGYPPTPHPLPPQQESRGLDSWTRGLFPFPATCTTENRKNAFQSPAPFSFEFLNQNWPRHGKVFSPTCKLLSGWKLSLLRLMVSHWCKTHMIQLSTHRTWLTSFHFACHIIVGKCFGCRAEGHLVRSCPKRVGSGLADLADGLASCGVCSGCDSCQEAHALLWHRNSGDASGTAVLIEKVEKRSRKYKIITVKKLRRWKRVSWERQVSLEG